MMFYPQKTPCLVFWSHFVNANHVLSFKPQKDNLPENFSVNTWWWLYQCAEEYHVFQEYITLWANVSHDDLDYICWWKLVFSLPKIYQENQHEYANTQCNWITCQWNNCYNFYDRLHMICCGSTPNCIKNPIFTIEICCSFRAC
jgi:hypothetical protein